MSIQWVPSHLGMVGSEHANQQAVKGAKVSLQQVTVHKTATNIWTELGLGEMPNEYSDSDVLGGGPGSRVMN